MRADGAYEPRTQSRQLSARSRPDRTVRTEPCVRVPHRSKGLRVQTRSLAPYGGTDAFMTVRLRVQERLSDPAPSRTCYSPALLEEGVTDRAVRSKRPVPACRRPLAPTACAAVSPFALAVRRRVVPGLALTELVLAVVVGQGEAVHATTQPGATLSGHRHPIPNQIPSSFEHTDACSKELQEARCRLPSTADTCASRAAAEPRNPPFAAPSTAPRAAPGRVPGGRRGWRQGGWIEQMTGGCIGYGIREQRERASRRGARGMQTYAACWAMGRSAAIGRLHRERSGWSVRG